MSEINTETKNLEFLDKAGLRLYDALIKAKISTDIKASEYDDTALKTRITANETAISTLNGEGEGSVKKQVADAVASIIADAPDAYNTLKEISDWISSHVDDASAMNSQIITNKNDISTLKALIGMLPEWVSSTTIVEYIAEAIGKTQSDLTKAIAMAVTDTKTYTDDKVKELSDGQVTTNKNDIASLQEKVKTLESVTYTPITEAQIGALFGE